MLSTAQTSYSIHLTCLKLIDPLRFLGSLKNSGNGVFDVSVSFKSQIPQYEDMMMSVSNAAFDGQVKPHFVMQWASDKKIELSATISWANSYRAIIDLSTPFNR